MNDRFGFVAKVGNATASEASQRSVKGLFLESGPTGGDRKGHTLYRLIANPGANTFELALASTFNVATNPA